MRQEQSDAALRLTCILCCACLLVGCDQSDKAIRDPHTEDVVKPVVRPEPKVAQEPAPASPPIVAAARAQVDKTIVYDPAYVGLDYPGGDVPIERGVCTDVVVRALRDALGMDLQKMVHEDMKAHFSDYPTIWRLKRPDRNIDHRRVPNLQCYLQRAGHSVPVTNRNGDYTPGDIVTCTVPPNRPHIMIVSDRTTGDGVPLVIHNIGRGAKEENRLFDFPLTGHYRIRDSRQQGTAAP